MFQKIKNLKLVDNTEVQRQLDELSIENKSLRFELSKIQAELDKANFELSHKRFVEAFSK